ncbi:putative ribonuclease H-like domain-containing protein, partial [Tanacetum coccineum]
VTNEPVVIKLVVENSKAKASEAKPKAVRKNNGAPIIEDWVLDSEEENVSQTKIEKKIAKPSFVKIDFRVNTVKDKNVNAGRLKAVVNAARPKAVVNVVQGNNVNDVKASACWDKGVIDSGCSRHMTGNMSYLTDYKEIDGGYVAFRGNPKGGKITGKGKQHKASCKSKTENLISIPLHLLHMDLFGPTFVKILMKKMYCLVVTDDYSRFTWVFFLATKDETSGMIKSFIIGIENLVDHKVKVIRCDNGTEFKNREMIQFCEKKGILRQYNVAKTPQKMELLRGEIGH